jgi:hypothetical protein
MGGADTQLLFQELQAMNVTVRMYSDPDNE